MIVYDLSCPFAHQFEGWYESSESFEKLKEQGLIECPICKSQEIKRVPSAPFIGSSFSNKENSEERARQIETKGISLPTNNVAAKGDFMELLRQQIIQLINSNTEDVGKDFAQTAKKIHYHEIPDKNIRGIATVDELQELQEEGIEVLVIGGPESSEIQH
ncbi:MAG: DUF1178 family protein [Betaproteobacteria bacterium]|nr:DUF1178 family protein [Betaproteobacteria bacterium]